MKKIFYLIILLTTVSCDLEPKLIFEDKSIDLGKVTHNTKKSFFIKFKNDGFNDLSILNIQSSCKCMSNEKTKKLLHSNSSDSIKFNFIANEKGQFHEKIVFLSNAKKKFEIVTVKSIVE